MIIFLNVIFLHIIEFFHPNINPWYYIGIKYLILISKFMIMVVI